MAWIRCIHAHPLPPDANPAPAKIFLRQSVCLVIRVGGHCSSATALQLLLVRKAEKFGKLSGSTLHPRVLGQGTHISNLLITSTTPCCCRARDSAADLSSSDSTVPFSVIIPLSSCISITAWLILSVINMASDTNSSKLFVLTSEHLTPFDSVHDLDKKPNTQENWPQRGTYRFLVREIPGTCCTMNRVIACEIFIFALARFPSVNKG